jgi:hypothetical protein
MAQRHYMNTYAHSWGDSMWAPRRGRRNSLKTIYARPLKRNNIYCMKVFLDICARMLWRKAQDLLVLNTHQAKIPARISVAATAMSRAMAKRTERNAMAAAKAKTLYLLKRAYWITISISILIIAKDSWRKRTVRFSSSVARKIHIVGMTRSRCLNNTSVSCSL